MSVATIAAIATGPAAGGIGIIRLSGPEALRLARTVAPQLPTTVEPRRAYFTRFVDTSGRTLDEGLVLSFVAPHSFTGEDVVELQTHGAPQLLKLLLAQLVSTGLARHAEPGEFTRRAFVNGRIDLARAEAVADLISAQSDAAVRAAAAQLTGVFSTRVRHLSETLVALAADLEAVLDFPDESDEAAARDDFGPRLDNALKELRHLQHDATAGSLIRRSPKVVLYGPVNAGKSTLFNALSGADKALVDAEAGTTRDVLETVVSWSGVQLTLVDTAGLRDNAGRIEQLGISRARTELQGADIAALIVPPDASPQELTGWRSEVEDARRIEVQGKSDLQRSTWNNGLAVSGTTGLGLEKLRAAIVEKLGLHAGEASSSISARHVEALLRAGDALGAAEQALTSAAFEICAAEIALCLSVLGEITGQDATAEVIDAIFRRFCIGK